MYLGANGKTDPENSGPQWSTDLDRGHLRGDKNHCHRSRRRLGPRMENRFKFYRDKIAGTSRWVGGQTKNAKTRPVSWPKHFSRTAREERTLLHPKMWLGISHFEKNQPGWTVLELQSDCCFSSSLSRGFGFHRWICYNLLL